jgi:hypothetical protein
VEGLYNPCKCSHTSFLPSLSPGLVPQICSHMCEDTRVGEVGWMPFLKREHLSMTTCRRAMVKAGCLHLAGAG